jgi:FkbM family methyltransferase
MQRNLIRLARRIYKGTPFVSLREFYYRAFCHLVRGGKICITVDGMTFDLDLGEVIDLSIYLQQFELEVAAAIERYCRPGWTVMDIGANIGAHTLRLAKAVGPQGQVFAFEPTDFAYAKLVRNISLNSWPNVFAYKIGLSDQNRQSQEINFRSSWRTDGKRADGVSIVDFQRLDDWCLANRVNRVDLIKLDVDGNEFPVLSGAKQLIERCRPLFLMEAVGPHFEEEQRNPYAILKKLNYRFWDLKSGEEYPGIEAMKALLPERDYELTESFNVIAALEIPEPLPNGSAQRI